MYHRLIKEPNLDIINFSKFQLVRVIFDPKSDKKGLYFQTMHKFVGQTNIYLKFSMIKISDEPKIDQNSAKTNQNQSIQQQRKITLDVKNYEMSITEFKE